MYRAMMSRGLLVAMVLNFFMSFAGSIAHAEEMSYGQIQLKYFFSSRLCWDYDCTRLSKFGTEPSYFKGQCVDEAGKVSPMYWAIVPPGKQTPNGKVKSEGYTTNYAANEEYFIKKLSIERSYQFISQQSVTLYHLLGASVIKTNDAEIPYYDFGYGYARLRKFDESLVVQIEMLATGRSSQMCVMERFTPSF